MQLAKRIALGVALAGAATAYVWTAAVRAVPDVKRRKAAARLARLEAARREQH